MNEATAWATTFSVVALSFALAIVGYNYTQSQETKFVLDANSNLEQCIIERETIWVKNCASTKKEYE